MGVWPHHLAFWTSRLMQALVAKPRHGRLVSPMAGAGDTEAVAYLLASWPAPTTIYWPGGGPDGG